MMLKDWLGYARLTLSLARIELDAQRKETFLGLVWVVLWPVLQAGGFLLVFHLIRGGSRQTGAEAILATYLGVLIWSTAVAVLMSNLRILTLHRDLILHIRFPFSILSVVDVTVKYVVFLPQLLVALVCWAALVPGVRWDALVLYLPLYLVAFYCALIVTAWLASLIGLAAPEVTHILSPALVVLLALSPVFQPDPGSLPWIVQWVNELNPLALWVSAFYATLGISGTGPRAPLLFLATALLALAAVRALVGICYRDVAKVV